MMDGQSVNLGQPTKISSTDSEEIESRARIRGAMSPWEVEPLLELAELQRNKGCFDEQLDLLGSACLISPADARIIGLLGAELAKNGRFSDAASAFQKQVTLQPDSPGPLHNWGVCLQRAGQTEKAEKVLLQLTSRFQDWTQGLRTWSTFLREHNRFDEAIPALLRLVRNDGKSPQDFLDLGSAYARTGRVADAIYCFRSALSIDPALSAAFDNLLSIALCDPRTTKAVYASLFKQADTFHPRPKSEIAPTSEKSSETSKVRIGFVSPDLYRHAVTSFLLPLVKRLPKTHFEVLFFSNSLTRDAISAELEALSDHWEVIIHVSDEAACSNIRALGVDVLVDLAGHFQRNRLGIFARRAAPMQITMIGCMGTTGLSEMDYRITDSVLDPVGTDVWNSERLVRLPSGAICLEMPSAFPPVSHLPALKNGYITFGSFNNLAKVNSAVLDTWAATLKMIPQSRFNIVAEQGSVVLSELASRGVAPSRITILSRMPEFEYLKAHHSVDIILDTFPYNGFTVTLLGAFMGVPCISCVGDLPSSRTALDVMSRLGLGDFIANSPSEIPFVARNLSSDLGQLATIRSELRAKMRSTWMNGRRYVDEFCAWLEEALTERVPNRLPLNRPAPNTTNIDDLKSLENTLGSLIDEPSIPPIGLGRMLVLAEQAGLDKLGSRLINRMRFDQISEPEVILAAIKVSSRVNRTDVISECIRYDWHLRDPSVAERICHSLSRGDVAGLTIASIAAHWQGKAQNTAALALHHCISLSQQGESIAEIGAACTEAVLRGSDPYKVMMALAAAATRQRDFSLAIQSLQKALTCRPGDLEAIAWLGILFNEQEDYQKALRCTSIAARAFPTDGRFLLSHAIALERTFNLEAAVAVSQSALKVNPHNPEIYKHLAHCQIRMARADLAVITLREAEILFPDDLIIHSNLLYCENYVVEDDSSLFRSHLAYQKKLNRLGYTGNPIGVFKSKKVRLGLISADFRRHSVAYFTLPWLKNINRNDIHIILVSTGKKRDSITDIFESLSDEWIEAPAQNYRDLANFLRGLRIDVLCDLSGHTDGNRLPAFALRCSPTQVTLIGAMQTTGLEEIDLRITDEWLDPVGTTEYIHSEKLVRMKRGAWVFEPPKEMPEVRDLPALKNGFITFGSFNNNAKVTPEVIATWAEVLHAIPNSRLLVNGFHFITIRDQLIARGVSDNRLEFIGRPIGTAYYEQHHRIDIALDTFPFNGLTVNCFAAWMGVPTLSHAERRPASRVGFAVASRLGLPEVIAAHRKDLSRRAQDLAGNLSLLAEIRHGLRDRMRSQICDAKSWADEIASLIMECPRNLSQML